MSLASIDIGSALEGIGGIIDEFKVTDEERSKAKAELLRVENDLASSVLEYESALAGARRDIIVAEAQSSSWIARNWRPVTMLTMTGIMLHQFVLYPYLSVWLNVPEIILPDWMKVVLVTGLGGYIVGRSSEKIVKTIRSEPSAAAVQVGEIRAKMKAEKAVAKAARKARRLEMREARRG